MKRGRDPKQDQKLNAQDNPKKKQKKDESEEEPNQDE